MPNYVSANAYGPATALFVGCAIGKISIARASKAMLVFWPPMLVALLLVTFFPWFVNFLPRLFGSP